MVALGCRRIYRSSQSCRCRTYACQYHILNSASYVQVVGSINSIALSLQVVRLLLASGADRKVLTASGKSAAAVADTRDIARLLAVDQVPKETHSADGPTAASAAASRSNARPADARARGPGGGKQKKNPEGAPTTPNRLMDYFVVLKQIHTPGTDEGRQVRQKTKAKQLNNLSLNRNFHCRPKTRFKARFATRCNGDTRTETYNPFPWTSSTCLSSCVLT